MILKVRSGKSIMKSRVSKRKKIVIDLTSLSYHVTGIERYALCISECLLREADYNFILVFRNTIYPTFDKYIDGFRVSAKILRGNNKLVFNQIILPYNLYKIKADKYLFLAFTSPMLFFRKGIVSTIHDMGAWDYPRSLKLKQKIYSRIGCVIAAKSSEALLTVSEFSKKRIADILKINPDKITVAYSAISDELKKEKYPDYEVVKKKYGLPEKYIMTLSTLEPRKNLTLLIDAFISVQEKVDYDVVLVGRKGWKIDELIAKCQKGRIHVTGFVEDDEVITLYKNAMCFVFPTAYEGFGLPPVEALFLGTPVISSSAASMPEVLRNQAILFENGDQKALADLLLHLNDNVGIMKKNLDEFQTANYCFDVSAKKVLEVLER